MQTEDFVISKLEKNSKLKKVEEGIIFISKNRNRYPFPILPRNIMIS